MGRRQFRRDLERAWLAHRPYLLGSALLFVVSMGVGVSLQQSGRGIRKLPISRLARPLPAQQFSVPELLGASTELFSLLVVGAVSAGVLTAVGLAVQGIVAGYFLALSVGEYGTGLLVVAVVPHGVLMFVGFVFAAAISFRLVAHTFGRLLGRQRALDGDEWRRIGLFLAAAWLALLGSALIEAHVTFRLVGLLF